MSLNLNSLKYLEVKISYGSIPSRDHWPVHIPDMLWIKLAFLGSFTTTRVRKLCGLVLAHYLFRFLDERWNEGCIYQISTQHTHIPPKRGRLLLGRQCNESQHQRGNNNSISSGGKAICLARYAQLKGGDAVASWSHIIRQAKLIGESYNLHINFISY